jgi:pimeloyl-ACP methyl ester carboxylesterase
MTPTTPAAAARRPAPALTPNQTSNQTSNQTPNQTPNPAPATSRFGGAAAQAAEQPRLAPALAGQRLFFGQGPSRVAAYLADGLPAVGGAARFGPEAAPMLLVHSVNAAASAAEVRPVYEAAAGMRPVMALELPGFGSSARHARHFTPEVMTAAVLRAVEEFRRLGCPGPVDLLAVSLSCEFAARAALAHPTWFRSVSLVSPTGLESRRLERYDAGRSKDKRWLRALLERGPWSHALFRLLTRKASMRKFLERTWGSKEIDEQLLDYNLLSVKEPGARHAPYAFIGGALFTRGAAHLYERLPQPVWLAHGTRGEFAKYDGLETVQALSAWTINAFDAGAMPYFDDTAEFLDKQARFLRSVAAQGASAGSPTMAA